MDYQTELPYGMRVFENGRVELFNRKYEVIRTSNPFEEERQGVRFYEIWFYNDANSPEISDQTGSFIRELLYRWDYGQEVLISRWSGV